MRAEAGEVVVLLVCEDWLPPAAGRNMRVVGDMTAAIYMIEFKMVIFWFRSQPGVAELDRTPIYFHLGREAAIVALVNV